MRPRPFSLDGQMKEEPRAVRCPACSFFVTRILASGGELKFQVNCSNGRCRARLVVACDDRGGLTVTMTPKMQQA